MEYYSHKRIVLSLVVAALSLFVDSSHQQQENSNSNNPDMVMPPGDGSCSARVEQANNCWKWHGRLPKCGEKSTLVKCAEIALDHMRECDPDTRNTVTDKIEMFARTDALLCGEKQLHKEFQDDNRCWDDARNCAAYVTDITNETPVDTCHAARERLMSCTEALSGSSKCHRKVQEYTSVLLESTPCRVSAASPLALSGLLILVSAAALVLFVNQQQPL